ncbi:class D sortase [Bacillus sp. FJAT-49705]|uniref:Class D sortase n=1 Tax=Cytobacillus citreus TaxID=2833586 RepID=A0ABS5NWK7_9BACI|nr:class D sortase [Cytobacillus citreus]MBS4191976.1 class D sortase [Cytobacillus citreus]
MGIFVLLFPFFILGYSKAMSNALQEEAESSFNVENSSENPVQELTADLISEKDKTSDMDETSPTHEDYQTGLYPEPAPELIVQPKNGEIIGMLTIPNLGIHEAILEGTGQRELAKAPGHLPGTVFPGQIGTSIIAAHNSSTFRHLDQLEEGMEFSVTTEQGVFTFSVTGQRILNVNDSLPDMAYPAIALETCYPLDALYLTDKRLFVEAALIKSELKPK